MNPSEVNQLTREVVSVQWLRGIAAMMVVFHHARNPDAWLFNPLKDYEALAWGVDIFFVISGFIMYVAARHERPWVFIQRRFVRVAPLYWAATLGLLLLTVRQHTLDMSKPEIEHLVRSLLFIPHYSLSHPDQIWPFLIPGWTLNYEMFFYVVFFLALLGKRPLTIVSAVIIALVGLGAFVDFDGQPIALSYTSPLMMEFVAGVWIGRLYTRQALPHRLALLLPVGIIGLLSLPALEDMRLELVGRILLSPIILIGTIAANDVIPKISPLKKLGDASYSIYLSHTVVGLLISRKLVAPLPISGWPQFGLWIITSLVVCAAVGRIVHALVEKPLLKAIRIRNPTS